MSERLKFLLTHPVFVWLVVCAVMLPGVLSRAFDTTNLWLDEIYTIFTVTRSVADIVEMSAMDAHPPGYYLLLKGWLKPLRMAGIEPTLAAGRLLGVLVWVLSAGAVAGLLNAIAGRAACALGTAAYGTSAALLHYATEIRQYSIGAPLLTVCFLLMGWLYLTARSEEDSARRNRRLAAGWLVWALLAAAALWIHLLTSFVLLWLGIVFLIMTAELKGRRSAFFLWGAVGMVIPNLLFLPWLLRLATNLQFIENNFLPWMTDPTLMNWWLVFSLWLPVGRVTEPAGLFSAGTIALLGAFAVLWPVAAGLLGRYRGKPPEEKDPRYDAMVLLGLTGLLGTVFLTTVLWALTKFDVIQVFHGPRYPVLAVGMFIIGLVLISVVAVQRLRVRTAWAVLPLAPLFLAHAGAYPALLANQFGEPQVFPPEVIEAAWEPGESRDVYVMPSEMIPFLEAIYPEVNLRPIEDLRDIPESRDDAVVMWLRHYHFSMRDRGKAIFSGMIGRQFSRDLQSWSIIQLELTHLQGLRHEELRRLTTMPWEMLWRDHVPVDRLVAWAVPEEQSLADGWSLEELEGVLTRIRHQSRETARLRFEGDVPAGEYDLVIRGRHAPHPPQTWPLFGLAFEGSDERLDVQVPQENFLIRHRVRFAEPQTDPVLSVTRATYIPADVIAGSDDGLPRAWTLYEAWLESPPAPSSSNWR